MTMFFAVADYDDFVETRPIWIRGEARILTERARSGSPDRVVSLRESLLPMPAEDLVRAAEAFRGERARAK